MSDEAPSKAAGLLRVTQTRSAIGVKPKHRGTLRALGLRRIGHSNEVPDRAEIRGMIARVSHLVSVAPADQVASGRPGSPAPRREGGGAARQSEETAAAGPEAGDQE